MTSIARGETSAASTPILDVFFRASSGGRVDVYSLEFQVFELVSVPGTETQSFPGSGRHVVDLVDDRVSVGHYAAEWTPGGSEPIGAHRIRWFYKLVSTSDEQTFAEDFAVTAAASEAIASASSSAGGYTTIEDLRDEGVTTAMASDARLAKLIARVSAQIEMWTGRYFEPRAKVLTIDGTGNRKLLFNEPIISIELVRILHSLGSLDDASFYDVGLDGIRVFNRHLTENLTDPDDRDSPKIEFIGSDSALFNGHFLRGVQNIEVTGVFGFTEWDGSETGRTPILIQHAANLMVVRELALVSATDDRDDIRSRGRIVKQKTRDQEVQYSTRATDTAGAFSAAGPGRMTGDAEIDTILERYIRPTSLGSA